MARYIVRLPIRELRAYQGSIQIERRLMVVSRLTASAMPLPVTSRRKMHPDRTLDVVVLYFLSGNQSSQR